MPRQFVVILAPSPDAQRRPRKLAGDRFHAQQRNQRAYRLQTAEIQYGLHQNGMADAIKSRFRNKPAQIPLLGYERSDFLRLHSIFIAQPSPVVHMKSHGVRCGETRPPFTTNDTNYTIRDREGRCAAGAEGCPRPPNGARVPTLQEVGMWPSPDSDIPADSPQANRCPSPDRNPINPVNPV